MKFSFNKVLFFRCGKFFLGITRLKNLTSQTIQYHMTFLLNLELLGSHVVVSGYFTFVILIGYTTAAMKIYLLLQYLISNIKFVEKNRFKMNILPLSTYIK